MIHSIFAKRGAASERHSFVKSVVSKAADFLFFINQAYLQSNSLGGAHLHRDFSLENVTISFDVTCYVTVVECCQQTDSSPMPLVFKR